MTLSSYISTHRRPINFYSVPSLILYAARKCLNKIVKSAVSLKNQVFTQRIYIWYGKILVYRTSIVCHGAFYYYYYYY